MSNQNWQTPPEFMEWVCKRFGYPVLDVCATQHDKKAPFFFGPYNGCPLWNVPAKKGFLGWDGLDQDWALHYWCISRGYGFQKINQTPIVWCNPPFSAAEKWHWKAIEARDKGATVLVLGNTSNSEWHWRCWERGMERIDLIPRIPYIDPDTGKPARGNMYNSTLCVYSPRLQPGESTSRVLHWREDLKRWNRKAET